MYWGLHPYPHGEQVMGVEKVCSMSAWNLWNMAALPVSGPARVFVRLRELSETYLTKGGATIVHPLTSQEESNHSDIIPHT